MIGFAADEKYRSKKRFNYCDVYHSANRYACGTMDAVPIVLPRSIVWSFQRQRPLLGRELLRCQGLSYHSEVLEPFSESQLTNLAGNAPLVSYLSHYGWPEVLRERGLGRRAQRAD